MSAVVSLRMYSVFRLVVHGVNMFAFLMMCVISQVADDCVVREQCSFGSHAATVD